ncbi:MAG: hypothetical protein JSV51_03880 [Candidatus Bathyarchaeota archaeon]|nr:MAG: hypothetical protein JSV51_03880 [Candidatus Bathyarchaeota archaeon]
MWIITEHLSKFRRNKRGVSNVIVMVLSLVILVIIASNIILWSYQMNQLDWEKINEDITITDVASVNEWSSWFTAQSEYTVWAGNQIAGTYEDTQVVDGTYERFSETTNTTLINAESFEGTWPPTNWTETGRWDRESQQAYDGIYSADFDCSGLEFGDLTTPDLDCSNASVIYVDFWYRDDGLDTDDLLLRYYDGGTWDTISDLGSTTQEGQWLHYQQNITDSQYFVSNFRIRWSAVSVNPPENAWIDYVTVKRESQVYQLDLDGMFNIDLSAYPSGSIQTVEILLRYMANDTGEKWFLKAYNWTSGTFNDDGFNSTAGHTPTTGWDYYAVNLTNQWNSYVYNNGAIYVRTVDEGGDSVQTVLDIDFLAVRVHAREMTQFVFYNDGSFTCHLVSLWINNSTAHRRYNIDLYVNAADTIAYTRTDISLPSNFIIRVVTERGNTATYSEG